MKEKTTKRVTAFLALLLCLVLVCGGCGATPGETGWELEEEMAADSAATNGVDDLTGNAQHKLIRTVNIEAETKDFDKFLSSLETNLTECNGYIQSQTIENDHDDLRYGNITVRIPSDKLDSFVGSMSMAANITYRASELEDVTDQYIDVESRIMALETEQTALLGMLEQATTISDIMAIQDRLTEVSGDLESYKARKKSYDNRVAYSTVTIRIDEVERESKQNPGFWHQAGTAISDSFRGVGKLLRSFALLVIVAAPYLLLGVVVAIVLAIIKVSNRLTRKKKIAVDKTQKTH